MPEVRNLQTSQQRFDALKLRMGQIVIEAGQARAQAAQQQQVAYVNDKQLRVTLPALAALHYEVTVGTYAVIPLDNHNGKSLQAHVRRALDKYDNQWNLFSSAESTAASPKLRSLLNSPQKLFVTLRWYLTANQPRPPVEFVQVMTKLTPGSDLYRYLLEEFQAWSA